MDTENPVRIIRNSATCKHCGDEIESKSTHDYVECKCGRIAVDGGRSYLRRVGSINDLQETSLVE